MLIQCGSRELDLSQPRVMAILNATPDSFSDGGRLLGSEGVDVPKALTIVERMLKAGADIIDVGGESTRPGATPVTVAEELDRVIPVVEAIAARFDVVISIDTSQPEVITEGAKVGAGLINDVRALQLDGALQAAASTQLPICLMHMKGDPATMQHTPCYEHCAKEVFAFLQQRINDCSHAGIAENQILVDPGIGFGKLDEHNLQLINALPKFSALGAGVLFGASRKSMIGRLLGRDLPDRLAGSLGFAFAALSGGAKILRVHDVAETVDIIKVFELTRQ
ncbi:dihydropteroate synthase [Marinagarivorans cellulosilyticus]|uniref:Dihydropteroate synthase n=1 Tax=Marinagarivorans cellulosilyticus TaxID=2721545 RepID=A0AAN1WGD4_9GAMM|nr:dihydropteroate synthase [Marinagarivorans cellulosilyticus]BCD97078.1 dihydropteroate synthase [Marinagarivorans cellulosilyticus]